MLPKVGLGAGMTGATADDPKWTFAEYEKTVND